MPNGSYIGKARCPLLIVALRCLTAHFATPTELCVSAVMMACKIRAGAPDRRGRAGRKRTREPSDSSHRDAGLGHMLLTESAIPSPLHGRSLTSERFRKIICIQTSDV
jgi:hypothetical protein